LNNIAIVGIHTGIGKTIVSAILVEAFKADYWKPIQAGDLENSDTIVVKNLVSNSNSFFHTEAYRLTHSMSPHAAAKLEDINIELKKIILPKSDKPIVVETAGGLLSPVNDSCTNLDLIIHLKLPVVLVTKNYLGSINHTMLTAAVLKQNNILIKGLIINGIANKSTEDFILENTGLKKLFFLNEEKVLTKEVIKKYANNLGNEQNFI
jgi:dethiobiotin synthetase